MLYLLPAPIDLPHASLSDAFGTQRTHEPVLWMRADDADEAPLPGEDVVSGRADDERTFVHHRTLGRIGAYAMIGGAALSTGALIWSQRIDTSSGAESFTALLAVTGGGAVILVGEGLMFAGGITAADDAHRLGSGHTSKVGWIGVGLTGGSVLLYTLTVASYVSVNDGVSPAIPFTLGTAAGLAGLGCGVAQLVQVNTFAREHDLAVRILPDRVQIAGRF